MATNECEFFNAVRNGDVAKVKTCIINGQDVNANDESDALKRNALMLACAYGHLHVVEALVRGGANIQITNALKTNALHWSCYKGHFDVAKWLVENGVNVRHHNVDGYSCVHFACILAKQPQFRLIKWLVEEQGADLHSLTGVGWSPLHFAGVNGRIEFAKWLVGKGLEVDAIDDNGQTPCHLACKNGHKETVQFFLETERAMHTKAIGSDDPLLTATQRSMLEVRDKENETPIDVTRRRRHTDLAQHLERFAEYRDGLRKCSKLFSGSRIASAGDDNSSDAKYGLISKSVEQLLNNQGQLGLVLGFSCVRKAILHVASTSEDKKRPSECQNGNARRQKIFRAC